MPRRVLQGVVVSDKNDKTVVIKVERSIQHRIYKKYMKRTKKYHAHDPRNEFKVGEIVKIIECPPMSKTKCWHVATPDYLSSIDQGGSK